LFEKFSDRIDNEVEVFGADESVVAGGEGVQQTDARALQAEKHLHLGIGEGAEVVDDGLERAFAVHDFFPLQLEAIFELFERCELLLE
jgi:hypothetical protein